MAMAVKSGPEMITAKALNRLALGSLAGAAYVLMTLAVVFYLLPAAWHQVLTPLISSVPDSPVDAALLWLADLGVLGGLSYGGLRLLASRPIAGIRAGITLGVIGFYCISLIALGLGHLFERGFAATPPVGAAVTIAVWIALLGFAGSLYFRKSFEHWLVRTEDQGWFNMTSYKASQGIRIRRGTMLCILVLVGCGIYTMLAHGTLRTGAGTGWTVSIPFTHATFTLLADLQFTVPILLTVFGLWLAYRVVNFPVFADFLIATEAEMNKVSWVTRRRLYQDTIVVLVTVLLLTLFMFLVDIAWVKLLESKWIRVLQLPEPGSTKTMGPQDW
jgi:preprotein translocase SecE subunit